MRQNQVTQVRGYADQLLRVKSNPADPSNRRISILVKNSDEPVPALQGTRVVNGPVAPAAENTKTAEGQPAPEGGLKSAPQATTSPEKPVAAPAQTQARAKPAAGAPATGLMGRLKNVMPGAKK